jgi:UDP-3-O-[3-hydroxymyristoyl] glucosamine N-acyltransferase
VHPSAIVDPSAQIGDRTSIGPHCVVGANSRIGADCQLHANVTIYDGVTIGNRVVILAGTVIGGDGFGYVPAGDHFERFPQVGTVEIADDVEIGANCTIDRGALDVTSIGQGTKLDNLVHVAHNCRIGKHVLIAAQTGLAGGVTVGDRVVMGGQVGVGDKANIESGAVLGGGSGVLTSKTVPAGEPMWGVPARPLREYLKQLAGLSRLTELLRELRGQRNAERDRGKVGERR